MQIHDRRNVGNSSRYEYYVRRQGYGARWESNSTVNKNKGDQLMVLAFDSACEEQSRMAQSTYVNPPTYAPPPAGTTNLLPQALTFTPPVPSTPQIPLTPAASDLGFPSKTFSQQHVIMPIVVQKL